MFKAFSDKKLGLIFLVFGLNIPIAFSDGIGCQHPYCNGPDVDPSMSSAERLKQELAEVGVERFTSSDYKPGIIKHIVLFRYAANVTTDQKSEVIRRFLALRTLAKRNGKSYILSIDTGAEISGEGVDQGLEQGFIVTFKSQGDRNYYVGQPVVTDSNFYEPAHQAFKDFVGPLLDQNGALVFDFPVRS
jgi:hypothetical protein